MLPESRRELPTIRVPEGRFDKCIRLNLKDHPILQEVMNRRYPGYVIYEDPSVDDYFVVSEKDQTLIVDFRNYEDIEDPFEGVDIPSSRTNGVNLTSAQLKPYILERYARLKVRSLYTSNMNGMNTTNKRLPTSVNPTIHKICRENLTIEGCNRKSTKEDISNILRNVIGYRPPLEPDKSCASYKDVITHRCLIFGDQNLKQIATKLDFPSELFDKIATFVFSCRSIEDTLYHIDQKIYPKVKFILIVIGKDQFKNSSNGMNFLESLIYFLRSIKRHQQLGSASRIAVCEVFPLDESEYSSTEINHINGCLEDICRADNIEMIRCNEPPKSASDTERELTKSIVQFVISCFH
ncbi:hypothetical protein ACOME3_004517 [Neoechinorhynchus agilis]